MKTLMYVLATLSVYMLGACRASKNVTSNDDYEYRRWKEEQEKKRNDQSSDGGYNYSESQKKPVNQPAPLNRVKREMNEVEQWVCEANDYIRASGSAIGYAISEKIVKNEALRDARNNLAQALKIAVEGAAEDYERNSTQNDKISAATISESVMKQFVAEDIAYALQRKYVAYDIEDNKVQIYVGVELRTDMAKMAEKAANILSREGVLENQYDRDRFIDKTKEELEEYKKRKRGE